MFGIFTIIMLFDQLSAIFDNTPYIDAIQNRRGIRKPKMECLEQVFGEPFSWRWFLPFRLPEKVFKEFKRIREDYLEMELSNNDSYLSQKDA